MKSYGGGQFSAAVSDAVIFNSVMAARTIRATSPRQQLPAGFLISQAHLPALISWAIAERAVE